MLSCSGRPAVLAAGFVWPCLPTSALQLPSGRLWLHEIKHDGFRVIARKVGKRARLYSRNGNDLTCRFPLIVDALKQLRSHSCIIDGEAVACGEDGIACFERIRHRRNDASVFLYAFDLIELNGEDLRRDRLEVRKSTLATLLSHAASGLRFNEHLDIDDGPLVFAHACKLSLEGIVSKWRDSPYNSGRSQQWIKSKNPLSPAVKREADEDWFQRWPRRARSSSSR
jgi:bifunctional non-homologous end joining protein LigD